MIGTIFERLGEYVKIVVDGNNVYFSDSSGRSSTIEGLKLDKAGVTREFPDLKDSENWKEEAIKRFKTKVASFNNEDEKMDYVIKDLEKQFYKPIFQQKQGFRLRKLK